MATITDTLSAHLEQVAERVAKYWSYDTQLSGKLATSKRATATRYLYRIPVEQYIGGTFQKYSADGGDMGSGTGMKLSKLTAGFFDSTYNFEITKEQLDLSASSEQSRVNVMSETLARAMQALQVYDNIYLHCDGTAKLTESSDSKPSTTTLTFAGATDTLGINRLWEGMAVDVWDSTGAAKRAGGPYILTGIDYDSKTVTFSSAVTGLTSGDLIALFNADVYGPSTLTAASSTWPGGGLTTAAGLTGDSWRHGLEYVNDATTSNYYLGVLKSTIPQMIPTHVDADGASLTWAHGELVKNKIIQRRGQPALEGMLAVMHMAQQSVIKDLGVSISRKLVNDTGNRIADVQPNNAYTDTFTFCDVQTSLSRVQRKSRVDYFNPKLWGRVEGHPAKFYEVGGQRLFPLRNATTANLEAGVEFKVVQKMDWVCEDPGACGYIDDLKIASGY